MAKRSFNIGEKVSSINDLVRGRVVRISGDKVVIHCEEGFEQEFDSAELIKISNWDHWIGDPATEESEGDQKPRSRVKEPAEESVKEVDLHLHEITEFESGMSNHEKLQLQLGTKVRIQAGKKGGKIEVEYYSDDELDRLIELLTDLS